MIPRDAKAIAKIEELESRLHTALIVGARAEKLVEDLKAQLKIQSAETQTMGKASMEIRGEDVQQLADYKATNTELVELIEKVANGRSKLRGEARALLGLE